MSSSYTQVEQQQNVAPPAVDAAAGGGEPQDVGAVVLKAKKAAASLWMILHAQVSSYWGISAMGKKYSATLFFPNILSLPFCA